jgi:FKBP-type peptidyl-prolyl cis-trans isomerase
MKTIYALLAVILIAGTVVGVFALQKSPQTTTNKESQAMTDQSTDSIQSTDEVVGTGAEAVSGKTVSVLYTGTLTDGTKFDSTADHGNQPFSFTLGGGQVIQGWDQGVVGMKVGGKRKLVIPPSMGYGDQAMSTIPANSTLVFEIELLDVK